MRGASATPASTSRVIEQAIRDYLDQHNADPKPFVWTKSADTILSNERRALNALDDIKAGYQASESEH